jgi:hypothetical protein
LAPRVDVDRFLTFWAMEVLLAHWDGYAGDANNYYVYADPATGRMEFIPWGIDDVFGGREISPQSILARGLLARRLYLLPETRGRYADRLRGLLASVWREGDLLAEVDRMEALIASVLDPDGSLGRAAAIEGVRQFIRDRRAVLLAELDPEPPEWTEPLRTSVCFREVGTMRATFSTTWGSTASGNPFASGEAAIELAFESGTPAFDAQGALAGYDVDGRAIFLPVGHLPDGTLVQVVAWLPAALVAPGRYPIDWVGCEGQVQVIPPLGLGDPHPAAFLGEGTLVLEEASVVDGAPVQGTIASTLLFW